MTETLIYENDEELINGDGTGLLSEGSLLLGGRYFRKFTVTQISA